MIKIALVSPSRGQVFSKMMESVIKNLQNYEYSVHMSHGTPLPDCYNNLIQEALETDCTHVWFVEEDHCFPEDTLKKLLEMDVPVATTAYVDRRSGKNIVQYQKDGSALYTGMGCMLVQRNVFSKLERPYFRGVFMELLKDPDGTVRLVPHPNMQSRGYGGQDIYFCTVLLAAGFKLNILKNAYVGHMMLTKRGEEETNFGRHLIKILNLPMDIKGNEIENDGSNTVNV